jgi:hypothetical protein
MKLMKTQLSIPESTKFIPITYTYKFTTSKYGYPMRAFILLLTAIIYICRSLLLSLVIIMYFNTADEMTIESICQRLQAVYLLLTPGPITQNFDLSHTNAVLIITEVIIKVSMIISINYHILDNSFTYWLCSVMAYHISWSSLTYIYSSYTNYLCLGSKTNEIDEANQSSSLFPYTQSLNTGLAVSQVTTIVLNNHSDIIYARDLQDMVVNQVTFPSGLVVPCGWNGKDWKVVGINIILI